MSKIQDFVNSYNTLAQENLGSKYEKQTLYNNARDTVITDLVDHSYEWCLLKNW